MALVRYSPFREMETLQRQMNRLFNDLVPSTEFNGEQFVHAPAVEISENDEAIHVKLEVPGMEAKDLDIQVTKEAVYVSGERRQENTTEDNGVKRTEFRYGKFQRVIPLSTKIENTDVKADYKDGILTLTLPKAEEEKNKIVKVNIG
ncbi:Hsp20/alpha crystallin family protein [Chroococcus sp. FPU101]|uniref:Hsp20/alpha crystallin family protein n=1 Tax=Chroococcus sp. FPU101 TaxID=1974212 RepID=UPI001A8DD64D|nr:Hsp20/alpha crystallin family protein [Chroococcus sp. FPU101]GFE71450.1 heat shock protein Hsp20 [Chroococcus sp. FPU101]